MLNPEVAVTALASMHQEPPPPPPSLPGVRDCPFQSHGMTVATPMPGKQSKEKKRQPQASALSRWRRCYAAGQSAATGAGAGFIVAPNSWTPPLAYELVSDYTARPAFYSHDDQAGLCLPITALRPPSTCHGVRLNWVAAAKAVTDQSACVPLAAIPPRTFQLPFSPRLRPPRRL